MHIEIPRPWRRKICKRCIFKITSFFFFFSLTEGNYITTLLARTCLSFVSHKIFKNEVLSSDLPLVCLNTMWLKNSFLQNLPYFNMVLALCFVHWKEPGELRYVSSHTQPQGINSPELPSSKCWSLCWERRLVMAERAQCLVLISILISVVSKS